MRSPQTDDRSVGAPVPASGAASADCPARSMARRWNASVIAIPPVSEPASAPNDRLGTASVRTVAAWPAPSPKWRSITAGVGADPQPVGPTAGPGCGLAAALPEGLPVVAQNA